MTPSALTRNRGRDDGRLQVRRRHAHAEVDAPTTLHSSRDIRGNRQVGGHNLSAGCAQSRGAFIFAMNQRAPAGRDYAAAVGSAYLNSAFASLEKLVCCFDCARELLDRRPDKPSEGLSMMIRDGDVELTRLLIQDGTLQRPL